jgi:hypothetical protein
MRFGVERGSLLAIALVLTASEASAQRTFPDATNLDDVDDGDGAEVVYYWRDHE